MTTRDREVVAALERMLVRRLGEPRYKLWFEQHTRFRWEDDTLVIGVPNHFFRDWLQTTFTAALREAAAEVFGRPMQVRFVIDPELFRKARRAQQEAAAPRPGPPPATDGAAPPNRAPVPARRWRTLSDFVVGPCNRLAHAAAVSLVEAPSEGPNPLVLYGPIGTGKSHLLEGICAGFLQTQPAWRVCFLSAEEFTNRFLAAMRADKLPAFRRQYRDCDALLIDDLQFLARKRATQEEFLHTFDALVQAGKPVAVTCDCHPKLSDDFTPQLADRLLGGVAWALQPPDPETRLALLRAKARSDGPRVPDDVLRYLAEHLRGNVRELEGALHSVRHYGQVAERPIDLALAQEALADLLRHSIRVFQLADVDRAVCAALHLSAGTLQSKQRAWAVSHPRMLAMYVARQHTAAAYSDIGRYFGGRNHSTVVAAEKKIRRCLETDGELVVGERRWRVRELIARIERELGR
ncbi:MAG: chromosomal replication initiator protein DnaA [Gemmataceae bacterium]|nr:chromosomal replication initiator protein DnaA [Gemmataceae bacterium]MDW8264850.1 chromosomal replication initiator protein DnaA [Gemmataceae bacterium]